MCHQIYMALPNRHGGAHRDSQMRTLKFDFSTLIRNVENPSQYLSSNQLNFLTQYSDGWLDDYEYNFEIINS